MLVYKADNMWYYVRTAFGWFEVGREDGETSVTLVEPEDREVPISEYMDAVLDDLEELTVGQTPFWVINAVGEALS